MRQVSVKEDEEKIKSIIMIRAQAVLKMLERKFLIFHKFLHAVQGSFMHLTRVQNFFH